MLRLISFILENIFFIVTIKSILKYNKKICNLIFMINILKKEQKISMEDANTLLDILRD